MHHARGQGTVEYIAVLLLVTLVLGGGTAAASSGAGADITTAVPHQVMRALCIVTGGNCDRDTAPCVTGSATDAKSWSATVAVVRLGHGRVLVRERRSDGTETVTLTTAPSPRICARPSPPPASPRRGRPARARPPRRPGAPRSTGRSAAARTAGPA